jgi:hypothetical protein
MNASELKPGIIVRGPVLPEPIEVLVVTPLGDVIKIVGAGQTRFRGAKSVTTSPTRPPLDWRGLGQHNTWNLLSPSP